MRPEAVGGTRLSSSWAAASSTTALAIRRAASAWFCGSTSILMSYLHFATSALFGVSPAVVLAISCFYAGPALSPAQLGVTRPRASSACIALYRPATVRAANHSRRCGAFRRHLNHLFRAAAGYGRASQRGYLLVRIFLS